jgi:hypothetical protein
MDSITLQTQNDDVTAGNTLGRVGFAASSEVQTGDARLVVAKIEAIAEGTFTAEANATKMVFYLSTDGAAADKMTLSSAGNLTVDGTLTGSTGTAIGTNNTGGADPVSAAVVVTQTEYNALTPNAATLYFIKS